MIGDWGRFKHVSNLVAISHAPGYYDDNIATESHEEELQSENITTTCSGLQYASPTQVPMTGFLNVPFALTGWFVGPV